MPVENDIAGAEAFFIVRLKFNETNPNECQRIDFSLGRNASKGGFGLIGPHGIQRETIEVGVITLQKVGVYLSW